MKNKFNYTEKIMFLANQTYKHYMKEYKKYLAKRVDLPYILYAESETRKQIFTVITEKRVDECFDNLIKTLFKKQDYTTLYKYGVLN